MVDDPAQAAQAGGLYEREAELHALEKTLAAARAGRGTALVIEGPAGIGKSRLLAAAIDAADRAGMGVLTAHGSVNEREFSFGVASKLLGAVIPDPSGGARRPTGDALYAALQDLYWRVVDRSDREPLLIAVDDAHWADEQSVAFLNHLAQRLDGLRIAVLIAVRTGEPVANADLLAEVRDCHCAALLRPEPLSGSAVASVVRASLPAAEDAFCAAAATATAGNPFFLRELMSSAIADAVPPTASGAGRLAGLGPDSVARSVLARLARLPSAATQVVRAAAVLGDGAPLRHVAELGDVETDTAVELIDRLVATDLLASGDPVAFAHPIVASAVYQDAPPAWRAQAHLSAAELLARDGADVEAVAGHLLAARRSGQAWVRETLLHAAVRARAHGSPRASLRYLRRALDEAPAREERGELLALAGLAEAEIGDGNATGTLADAVALIDDPVRRARAMFNLALVVSHTGRHHEASRAAEQGRAELGGADPVLAAELDALAAMSGTYVDLTDPHQTARRIEASLAKPDLDATPAGRAALGNASVALAFAGRPAKRLAELATRAVRRQRPDDDPFDLAAFTLGAYGLVLAGDLEAAERASTAAVDAARRRGSILEYGPAVHVRSMARRRTGRIVAAIADAEAAVETGRWGWGTTLPMAHAELVYALLERGEVVRAAAALELPGGEERWMSNVSYGAYIIARAAVWHAEGREQEALQQLRLAGRLAAAVHARHAALAPWRVPAAEILRASGDPAEARFLIDEDLAEARAFGAPIPIGAALRGRALAGAGDEVIPLLRESEQLLAATPAALEHARTLVELGAAHRRDGCLRQARDVLRRGLDAAHACGATVLVDRAVEELRVAGARPRRPALTGAAALTPAERRVVELARGGLSNRKVAEQLFVTRRTVEMHLSAAYRKLGIAGREQLAAALDGRSRAAPR